MNKDVLLSDGMDGSPARPLVGIAGLSVFIAGIAALTGGQSSPWVGLFGIPLVLAGFISLPGAMGMAAVCVLLYLGVSIWLPAHGWHPELRAAAQCILFYTLAGLTGGLMRRREAQQRQTHQAVADTRHALDIQHMINTAYDLNVVLDLVILKQRELLPAKSYAILLTENNVLRVSKSSGLTAEGLTTRLGLHEDDHGWSPAEGKPFVLADTAGSTSPLADLDPSARSFLAVPLQSVERLVGLLFFAGATVDAFDTAAVDAAEAFANRVVFPIQRALLEEELKRLAFTDSQTSLFNHRHFQAQLDEEVSRAQRYGRPASIILMDIDNFKRFNDTYGHPAGDKLLTDLSAIIRDNLRTVDIAARYGGEEFVVICPETQGDSALILADRLRAVISETPFVLENGTRLPVTVSVGVASFPGDAQNKSELVDAADKALYEAKRSGKNRVVAYKAE